MPVGMGGELFSNLFGQSLDLFDDDFERGQQRVGDVGVRGAFLARGACGGGGQAGVQGGVGLLEGSEKDGVEAHEAFPLIEVLKADAEIQDKAI